MELNDQTRHSIIRDAITKLFNSVLEFLDKENHQKQCTSA